MKRIANHLTRTTPIDIADKYTSASVGNGTAGVGALGSGDGASDLSGMEVE